MVKQQKYGKIFAVNFQFNFCGKTKGPVFATLENGILVDLNLKRNLSNNTLHWIYKSCKNQEYVKLFFYTFWSNASFYSRCDKFQIFEKEEMNRTPAYSIDEGLINIVG